MEKINLSKYIMEDLKKEGYEGKELEQKFKEIKEKLPLAIERLSEEALKNESLTHDMDFDKFFEEE